MRCLASHLMQVNLLLASSNKWLIENWNSANGFIYYGRGGEASTNNRDEQEISILKNR